MLRVTIQAKEATLLQYARKLADLLSFLAIESDKNDKRKGFKDSLGRKDGKGDAKKV